MQTEIEKVRQEERERIINLIKSKFSDDDLIDADPVALALDALADEIQLIF